MKKFLELALALTSCALLVSLLAPHPKTTPEPGSSPTAQATQSAPAVAAFDCPHSCKSEAASDLFSTFEEAGPPEKQLVILDRVLKIEPDAVAALFHRGQQLERLGRYKEAEESVSKAIKVEPGFAKALNARAYYRSLLGDPGLYQPGLQDVELALQLEDVDTFYDTRGYLLLKLGRTREALLDMNTAVQRQPIPDHLKHRAEALRLLGRNEEAEADEKRARAPVAEDGP